MRTEALLIGFIASLPSVAYTVIHNAHLYNTFSFNLRSPQVVLRQWSCADEEMTKDLAIKLYKEGANYLDGDFDGDPCENLNPPKEGKIQSQ